MASDLRSHILGGGGGTTCHPLAGAGRVSVNFLSRYPIMCVSDNSHTGSQSLSPSVKTPIGAHFEFDKTT